jgi:hypothetical protein
MPRPYGESRLLIDIQTNDDDSLGGGGNGAAMVNDDDEKEEESVRPSMSVNSMKDLVSITSPPTSRGSKGVTVPVFVVDDDDEEVGNIFNGGGFDGGEGTSCLDLVIFAVALVADSDSASDSDADVDFGEGSVTKKNDEDNDPMTPILLHPVACGRNVLIVAKAEIIVGTMRNIVMMIAWVIILIPSSL